jgi:hypothetical protein
MRRRIYYLPNRVLFLALLIFCLGCGRGSVDGEFSLPRNFTTGSQTAKKYGTHEISLKAEIPAGNPFDVVCRVTFVPPSGFANAVTVYAFYDGEKSWRARTYINEVGNWHWTSKSLQNPDLDGKSGMFQATNSNLRGMLRKHSQNSRHWMTEGGKSFLNLADTATLLFRSSETRWQRFVKDDWELGISTLLVGALGGVEWDPEPGWWGRLRWGIVRYSDYPWDGKDKARYDLDKFRTTDTRLKWMLNNYPDMYVQLILLGLKNWGKDDNGPEWYALPPPVRENTMRYMISRWAAFPQVFWLVVNDMDCDARFPKNQDFARQVGRYFAANDPWKHLLSSGPTRASIFPFTAGEDSWVSYVHLQDQYQLGADVIHSYDKLKMHIFLGEDRYEQDRFTKDPKNPQYYNRWLFWSWILSEGSACYGGRWRFIHPYSETGSIPYDTGWGDEDESRYTKSLVGLNSVRYLKQYFNDRNIELWHFRPDDSLVSDLAGSTGRRRPKLMRRGSDEFLIYHPNADKEGREAAINSDMVAGVRVNLKGSGGVFEVEWYRPEDGVAQKGNPIQGSDYSALTAPWKGSDVVLRLVKRPS